MKKLTLEKAQELLEFLKGKAANGDITMSQENYLQALELALTLLDAQEEAEQFGSAFILCRAGEAPHKVSPDKVRLVLPRSAQETL